MIFRDRRASLLQQSVVSSAGKCYKFAVKMMKVKTNRGKFPQRIKDSSAATKNIFLSYNFLQ